MLGQEGIQEVSGHETKDEESTNVIVQRNESNSVIAELSAGNFHQHGKRWAVFRDFMVVHGFFQGRRNESRSRVENIGLGSLRGKLGSRNAEGGAVWLR